MTAPKTDIDKVVKVVKVGRVVSLFLVLWAATIGSLFISTAASPAPALAACTLRNPIVTGADPSVWYRNGTYYLVQSDGANHIYLRASSNIGGLGSAANTLVWTAPGGTDHSTQLWAPELEYLNGRWTIYFAGATDTGNFDTTNTTHRIFAIQANTDNALGAWSFAGKIADPTNEWAIDPTVFYYSNNWYMLWSGTPPGNGGAAPQQIYIAHMSDPLHIDASYRKLIGNPDQSWETSVAAIEEGPEAFINPSNNKLTIVYSANASWTTAYNLGELVYNGGDIGYYASYTKHGPIFSSANGVFGPGHVSLPVPSAFGYWTVYHAKTTSANGWDDRKIFAQPQTWNSDGTPNFGSPQGNASFDESTGSRC